MNKMFSCLVASTLLLSALSTKAQHIIKPSVAATAQSAKAASYWQGVSMQQAPGQSLMRSHPQQYKVYMLNEAELKPRLFALSEDPAEGIIITLPMADGTFRDFKVWQTPVMDAELAAKYPEIRTFTGEALHNKMITAKLDFTVFGFHAMIFDQGNTSFIDPYDNQHDGYYMVHYKKDEQRAYTERMKCGVTTPNESPELAGKLMQTMQYGLPSLDLQKSKFDALNSTYAKGTSGATAQRTSNGQLMRTYKLALTADSFYCKAATGIVLPTKAQAFSAMTTSMNRVNGVYNREFAVQMNFVTHEDTLIFGCAGHTNGNDPFALIDNSGPTCLGVNQTTCDNRIGTANYNIGHVFTTGGGGIAALGCVCAATIKGEGVTGLGTPTGDGFDIDYVAHEMGHQFGSGHTFANNIDGSCTGNYDADHAYEPASGSTIMDYAGICNPDDVQPHSDPYFSASSIEQIVSRLISSETCFTSTATANDTGHVATFSATYNIPYKTPFELTGPTAGTSVADTAVTYCWYQWNLAGASEDAGVRLNQTFVYGPIFRSFQPVYTPYRVFPKLSLILAGTLSDAGIENAEGEKVPDTARYLTFKMNVRTILAGKGCVNIPDDSIHINALATGAANFYRGFKVTSQGAAVTYAGGSTQTITWDKVNTPVAPISCSTVDIYMSTDGGQTWPYIIGNYPNTGTATVTLPNPTATSATTRIKVKGSGNVFFNINGANITVTHTSVPVAGPITGTFTVCAGSTTALADTSVGGVWFSSNTAVGTVSASGVVTGITAGTTTISYTVAAGTATQVVTVNPAVVAGTVTGPASVCTGATIALADGAGTAGGIWSSSNTARATVDASGIVTGVAAGTVNISYHAANSCGSVSAFKTITVNASPASTPITGTLSICNGTGTILSNSTPSGVWSSSTSAVAVISSAGSVTSTGAGTTTISYVLTNASGCSAIITAVLTVNAVPAATTDPSGSIVICTGTTVTINAAPATAGNTYVWQSGGFAIPGATNSSFVAATDGDYRVLITSAAGCTGTSAAVNVTVSSSVTTVPAVTITADPGFIFCGVSTAVTFTAHPVNGGSAPAYVWTVNGMVMGGPGNTFTYTPANGDVVGCQLTSSSICSIPATATTTATITVTPPVTPSVSIAAAPNDTVCTGSGVTYSAVPIFGGTAPTYQWSVNGTAVATGPTFTTVPGDGDVVTLIMTSNFATCTATSTTVSSPAFIMHVAPVVVNSVAVTASSSSIAAGENITFVAIAINGGTTPAYQWFIGTTPVAGATNATFTTNTLSNGQIVYCKETSSMLCAAPHTALSGGFTIAVTTGVDHINGSGSSFALMPNPNRGSFTITGTLGASAENEVAIVINNILGQAIYKTTAQAVNGSLNAPIALTDKLPNGTYFVNVIANGEHVVFHMVINK